MGTGDNEHVLEMLDIDKAYPGVQALRGVQLCVRPAEVHALVGENGAGKSTLMKILAGAEKMDAGRIRLVNNSDNQPVWEGAEALYVDGLTLNAGATIDLNGLNLYYLNDGPPKQFFCGDVNLDGAVDGGDFNLWADHYLQTGMSWGEGDLNGDGVVDGGDFTLWADNYGSATAAAIPEPAALSLLAIGAVALIRRRG